MLTQSDPVRPQQCSLCVLMATRTESAAFSGLQTSPGLGVVWVGHLGHHPEPLGSAKLAWKCWCLCFPGVQAGILRGFHHPRGVSIIPRGFNPSSQRGFQHPGGVSSIPVGFPSSQQGLQHPRGFPASRGGFHHPGRDSIIPKGVQSIIPTGFPLSQGVQSSILMGFSSSQEVSSILGGFHHPRGFLSFQQGFHHLGGGGSVQHPEGFPSSQWGFHHPSGVSTTPEVFSASQWGFHHSERVQPIIPEGFPSSQWSFHHPEGFPWSQGGSVHHPKGFLWSHRCFHHPSRVSSISKGFSPSSWRGFHGSFQHPGRVSIIPRGFHAPAAVSIIPAGPGSLRAATGGCSVTGLLPARSSPSPRTASISDICWKFSEDFRYLLEIERGFQISAGNSASCPHPGEGKPLGDFGDEMWGSLVARGNHFF